MAACGGAWRLGGLPLEKFGGSFLRGLLDSLGSSAPSQNHRNARDCYAEFICKLTDGPGVSLENFPNAILAQLRLASVCFSLS